MLNTLAERIGRRNAEDKPRSASGVSPLPRVLALLLASLFAALPARADSNPGNDSDSITITIAPVIDLGVAIDTAAVNLNMTLSMGATGFTVSPATVTVLGNLTPQEVEIEAANVSASPVWTPDDDETAALDEVQVYALFSVNRSSRPLEAEFSGDKNLIKTTAKRAGAQVGATANGNFENDDMTGGADMDNMPVGTERQMWLRVDAPPLTSTGAEQKIQITVTATRNTP